MTEAPPAPLHITLAEVQSRVGQEIAVSPWVEVPQALIERFAEVSRDDQWIHVDPERAARESPFKNADGQGVTVAHGFLTVALLTHLRFSSFVIDGVRSSINMGFDKLRFTAPVPSGGRIRARFKLGEAYEAGGGVQLVWNVTVELEGSKRPVLLADWLTRVMP
jgi:acyl dehydratase